MPFRTILAVVRDQDNAAAIFASAFGLCDTPDCHVIGYHAADAVDVNPALRGPLLEEWTRKALDKRALVTREIHKAFTAQPPPRGLTPNGANPIRPPFPTALEPWPMPARPMSSSFPASAPDRTSWCLT
jgi:hypothetical protein